MTKPLPGWSDLDGDDADLCSALCDPERLRTLERSGLGARPDPEMDFYAAWVCRALSVPGAAVSLVRDDAQVMPGAAGLGAPLDTDRSVPLSHSLCQWVIAAARPLVIPDTLADPQMRENLAVSVLGMRAYAGIPLFDRAGRVLGSLCAVDHTPRTWSPDELETLTDIARACATELRLRLSEHDAVRDDVRRDRVEAGQRRAHDRSLTLLAASQAFVDTVTVDDVRAQVVELLNSTLGPSHLDVAILDGDEAPTAAAEERPGVWGPGMPAAEVVERRRILHYPDRAALDRAHPGRSGAALRALGLQSVVVVPLPTSDRMVGAVLLGWTAADAIESTDLLTIATIAGYAGHALGRARFLSHRTGVAHEMQKAMLTELPRHADLPMAARYVPGDSRETVGGDWYDAAPLVDPARPDDEVLLLSVGDIVGHSLPAVTVMGQVRCMLRQAAADHPGGPPSLILEAVEAADEQFDIGAAGTAVVAQLRRGPDTRWSITWTNAGHPAPILLRPDGTTLLLDEHDTLFGFRLTAPGERADHTIDLPPGTLLFFYTDGLVERRDSDVDTGTRRLIELLTALRDREPQDIVDTVVDTLDLDRHDDDAVAFAVRIPAG
ncbi:GAF domain-containing SpoIIE family protein phosphatase [Pseudonocardia alni]|uniref:GAF domain-containing protein n=1 Tax=Pseudonocardia alni TaxID=33907 RepID=A0A852W057_PSEA5|nr:SpoIIE family protein phosphatase [Pseudonocardia antarctica]NYG00871.1 GAF domain-containing protein [Pseudonocardia antarctica]